MNTSHKRTRMFLGLLVCLPLIGVLLMPGKAVQAVRSAFNRSAKITAPASKAAPAAMMQDKNVQQGKPEPPSEVSVLEYNGPKPPNQNIARNLTVASKVSEVEPNGTTATASPIGTGSAKILGDLYPNGDTDFYSFTATAGDKVYAAIMTSFSAGSSTDSQLTIFASDGTTILEFDDDNGSFAALSSSIAGTTIPSTGTYYLRVNDFTGVTTSERGYELWFNIQSAAPTAEVEGNDTPATANPLPANGHVSGTRNPASATEQDWYSFNLNAGDTVYLSLDLDPERDLTVWNGRLGLALFGDAANQILVIDDAGTGDVTPNPNRPSESLFITVKTAGTYYAFVDSASAATGGPTATYNLSVAVLPAATGLSCTTYTSTDVPQTIGPGTGLVSSTITVPGNPRIEDIDVEIQLNHALMQDIDAHLRSPAGNDNGLFTDIGAAATGGQTMMDLIFDDDAATPPAFTVLKGLIFKPENNSTAGTASTSGAYRLSSFYGEDAGGTWTLDLRDDTTGANGGTLTGWSIKICTQPPAASCPMGMTPVTVFSTDFESGAAGFTHSGAQDEWQLGLPATLATTTANPIAAFNNCASGVNCWKTDLTGTYNASSNQDLLSPNINLAGYSAPVTVTWSMRHQIETANFDHMFVDFQQVGGAAPVRLYEWKEPTPISASAGTGNPQVNIGGSYGWGRHSRRADSLAGLNSELRFHLDSDTTVQFGGLAVDDVTITACRPLSADLNITKDDGVTTAVPGGSVTYTITASNVGPDGVTGATVADTFPAIITGATWTCVGAGGGTCTLAGSGNINDTVNLPSGASVTYTVTANISASATGNLVNTATVSSSVADSNPANNSATDTDTLTPQANLGITKTDGVASAVPGQSVTYTIVASNAGPSNAPGSTVADTFPAIITGATWTCVGAGGGTCTLAGSGNINDTVNLPSGASVTYTVTANISASATGSLVNTATVSSSVADSNPANNSATDTDTLTPQANLGITKTDGVASAVPGQSVTYTIVASNAGPSNAPGSTVADTFPAAITGATWTCVGAGGGTCTLAGSGNINDTVNLPAGGSVTYTVTAAISASATGTLSNTATVATGGGVTDPTPGNNSATDTDTLTPQANLGITKTNGTTSVTAGGTTTYTIVASNTGPSDAPGSTVADTFPASITGVTWTCVGAGGGTCPANGTGNINAAVNLPVGGSVTFTAVATISGSANGTLVNTATVATAGGVTDPTPGNNTATDSDAITIPCTITCPADQVAWTSTTSAVVNYSAPTTGGGGCGTVTCTPLLAARSTSERRP
jgi:uncharacterized repeat protein (TIGR01451 family)